MEPREKWVLFYFQYAGDLYTETFDSAMELNLHLAMLVGELWQRDDYHLGQYSHEVSFDDRQRRLFNNGELDGGWGEYTTVKVTL